MHGSRFLRHAHGSFFPSLFAVITCSFTAKLLSLVNNFHGEFIRVAEKYYTMKKLTSKLQRTGSSIGFINSAKLLFQ